MKTFTTFVMLMLFAPGVCAALNKWTDEKGVVHYSDTRPSGVQADSVYTLGAQGTDSATTTPPKTWAEREVELKKSRLQKQEADEKRAKAQAAQEERLHNCEIEKENLRTLESGIRIVTYDTNGEKVFMDDATREQRIQAARKAVQENCN